MPLRGRPGCFFKPEFRGYHISGKVGSETPSRGPDGPLQAGTNEHREAGSKGKDRLVLLMLEVPKSVWGERKQSGWVSDNLGWAQLLVLQLAASHPRFHPGLKQICVLGGQRDGACTQRQLAEQRLWK